MPSECASDVCALGSRYAFYGCSLSVTSKCLMHVLCLSLSNYLCSSSISMLFKHAHSCSLCAIFCVCSISVLRKSAFCVRSSGGCSATCHSGLSSLHNLPAPHLWTWSFKPLQVQFGRSLSGYVCLPLSLSLSQRKRFLQVE